MSKHKAPPPLSRKHMALAKRERLVSRLFLVGVSAALVAVAVLVGYGLYEQEVVLPNRPAAVVNGEAISREELSARTALAQADLLQQRRSAGDMLNFFIDSPEIQQQLQQQISQIDALLNNPNALAAQTLERLIQARLIRHEAEARGIAVTDAEVQQAIEEAFGFFAGGTPTPGPTATSDSTLAAQRTAEARRSGTATPSATADTRAPSATPPGSSSPTPEATATSGPSPTLRPTATPYTRQGFEAEWQQYVDELRTNLRVEESYLRESFAEDLYRERLRDSFRATVPIDEEQVWAKHILVSEESVAQAALDRLAEGESWEALAAGLSLDTSNKDIGGDLGWFSRGAMVDAFAEAAFAGEVGDVIGPVRTEFGWHLILIVDHAMRRLDGATHEAAVDRAFSTWLADALAQAALEFDPQVVPPTATPTISPTPVAEAPGSTATPTP
jgi:parvulin-like peptidyl-prolyl isomerase